MISDAAFWTLTVLLGLGTFLIRFSFLGLLGGRPLPGWLLLHLKYVGVAVLPALVTPMVLWPAATGGETDPARLVAALAALVAGLRLSVVAALIGGMGALYLWHFLFPTL
ncbi:AzlD domain-containing protein [Rhodovulum euryhalinum]|uniref:Branched-subunit amino acid transport protein n=1 Tax=Rhodovulum euryhalinum TaxID=35805 RepID=A0A4R2KPE9_9RHOB|nr:AzlD domain-containing protein [Rhodovulum euryhalinum]TCO71938.1 branched-subunit amino acid transport protein [Rhodovulum euryhalinum]